MKKQPFPVLVTVTCIFLSFILGLWVGRNSVTGSIRISGLSDAPIHAGMQPAATDVKPQSPQETVSFPIDINSATEAQLTELPGIGETLAQRILSYRMQNGAFSSPEELLNIEGIGHTKLEAILDLITTGGRLP